MKYTSNVTKEDAKTIEEMVKQCLRLLRKKEYELYLPKKTLIPDAIDCLSIRNTPGVVSRAGRNTIKINIGSWQVGNTHYQEYKAFATHPTIGSIKTNSKYDSWFVIVAHEMSHYIQYTYAPNVIRFMDSYAKPHGNCFKAIYTYLRRDLVNPVLAINK